MAVTQDVLYYYAPSSNSFKHSLRMKLLVPDKLSNTLMTPLTFSSRILYWTLCLEPSLVGGRMCIRISSSGTTRTSGCAGYLNLLMQRESQSGYLIFPAFLNLYKSYTEATHLPTSSGSLEIFSLVSGADSSSVLLELLDDYCWLRLHYHL